MVVIHFHGGAYVLGGARQMESGWGPEVLSKRMGCPVLQVQYRLAIEPNSCFPAAVQDGITAYNYVLKTLGVKPENFVLSGESAGGNLVLAMLRYLSTYCKGILPLPRAGLCWSPWLDMTVDTKALDKHPSVTTDYVFGSLIAWAKRCYIPTDLSPGHPYLSPLGNEFDCPVPIFVQTGTAEVLYEDHVLFAERMKEKGCKIELLEIENAPHDTFGAGIILGFAKEAENAADQAAKFVREASGEGVSNMAINHLKGKLNTQGSFNGCKSSLARFTKLDIDNHEYTSTRPQRSHWKLAEQGANNHLNI
ncbi:alpha beta hydrolase fold-3 domain containing protein [Rutstroemia sp. NJR-2017a WRK4]|nr:alpha beta hydrolase fold-3 domain containing protein [Rutstroemia sp. NJR-2017a WRK4]